MSSLTSSATPAVTASRACGDNINTCQLIKILAASFVYMYVKSVFARSRWIKRSFQIASKSAVLRHNCMSWGFGVSFYSVVWCWQLFYYSWLSYRTAIFWLLKNKGLIVYSVEENSRNACTESLYRNHYRLGGGCARTLLHEGSHLELQNTALWTAVYLAGLYTYVSESGTHLSKFMIPLQDKFCDSMVIPSDTKCILFL